MRSSARQPASVLHQGNGPRMGGADCVSQRSASAMEGARASWEQRRLENVWTLRLDPEDPAGHTVQPFIQRPPFRDGFLSPDHQCLTRAVLPPKDIWHCLEILLIIPAEGGGRWGAVSGWGCGYRRHSTGQPFTARSSQPSTSLLPRSGDPAPD